MINEIINDFHELFTRASIEIENRIKDKIFLNLDYALIRQALINIIVNAYQAMPEGGKIIFDAFNDVEFVKISIKDTGHGIDSEIVERIFDPFFSTKDRGTGLGLSITQSIVSAHSGKIEVKSEINAGTEFAIYLPLR